MISDSRTRVECSEDVLHRLLLDAGAGLLCEPNELGESALAEAFRITSAQMAQNQPISFGSAAATYAMLRCGSTLARRRNDANTARDLTTSADAFLARLVGPSGSTPVEPDSWLGEFAMLGRRRRGGQLSSVDADRLRRVEAVADRYAQQRIGGETTTGGQTALGRSVESAPARDRPDAGVELPPTAKSDYSWVLAVLLMPFAVIIATVGDAFKDFPLRVATVSATLAGAVWIGSAVDLPGGTYPGIALAVPGLCAGGMAYWLVRALSEAEETLGCFGAVVVTAGAAAVLYLTLVN